MFKPLLRTLPTLSGNFTISCKLKEFKKENNDDYSTYVRLANLIPLQNYMTNRNIELNLLNGKYEHDVKKYYYYYSNVFYNENFKYSKNNYAILDLQSIYNYNNDARNKDYEFGCKRMYYSQVGTQFNFYAPFYLDNINDLPEYFKLNIIINEHLTKSIKIYLNKDNKANYLKTYLKNYYKNVDDRVIFCLPDSLQATYFGIDVKKGGIVQYKDNIFGTLYKSQTTINNFDYTICKGFERNNLIMKQIIPLSFSFNINDLFNSYEKKFFENKKFKIYGHYYTKGNLMIDMYDFDINYTHIYQKYKKYNEYTGTYEYKYGMKNDEIINIADINYPSLNESKYIKYAYTNKITPKYCKFKLLLSDDNDPYITNASYGYTYNQYPNEKYGYFPTMFKGEAPNAVIYAGDFKLPIGKTLDTYYKIKKYSGNKLIINNSNANWYNKLMNNYHSTWMNTVAYNSYDDSIYKNKTLWSDVKYDYTYFNGVLYNLNKLKKYNIDKFGIFGEIKLNTFTENDLNTKLLRSNMTLSSKLNSYGTKVFSYNETYDMSKLDEETQIKYYRSLIDLKTINKDDLNILYDNNMIQDIHGSYIKENNYLDEMCFYKIDDVIKMFGNSEYEIYSESNLDIITQLYEKQIIGYELIDALNNMNYFEDSKYNIETQEYLKQFIFASKVFNTQQYNENYNWLKESLYYSTQSSTQKYLVNDSWDKLDPNENLHGKFCMFIKDSFINKSDIIEVVRHYHNNIDSLGDLENLLYNIYAKLGRNIKNISKNELPMYQNFRDVLSYIFNIIQVENSENYTEILLKLYSLVDNCTNIVQLRNIIEKYNLNIETQNIPFSYLQNSIKQKINQYYDDIDAVTREEYIYGFNALNEHLIYKERTSIFKEQLTKLLVNCLYNNLSSDEFNALFTIKDISILSQVLNNLNNNTIKKYKYEFYTNKNGIEITDYFYNVENDLYEIPIYVDSYNIDNIINEYKNYVLSYNEKAINYNKTHTDKIELIKDIYTNKTGNYIDNSLLIPFYIKFLNKNHIIEYFSNIFNKSENILDNIYVKERCFDVKKNKLNVKDRYVPLFDYLKSKIDKYLNDNGFKINPETTNIECTLDNLTYQDIEKNNKLLNEIEYFVYLYNLNNKQLILEWLENNLSDLRSINNNFTLNIDSLKIELNLCYNTYVIKLNNELKQILKTGYYLYTYIPDKCINENNSPFVIYDYTYTNIYDYKNINNYLIPLFTDIYFNDYDKDNILSILLNNRVNSNNYYILNNNNYFKEIHVYDTIYQILKNDDKFSNLSREWLQYIKTLKNENGINVLSNEEYNQFINVWNEFCHNGIHYEWKEELNEIDLDKIFEINEETEFTLDYILWYIQKYDEEYHTNIYRYIIYNKGIILYSKSDSFGIEYNTLSGDLIYDDELSIYIKHYNNKTYAFYWLMINIDNTNNSFNVADDYNFNVIFNSIDNHNLNEDNFNIYLKNIFYIIEPFLKINIFNEFAKINSMIYYPYETEIDINYINVLLNNDKEQLKYQMLMDNNTDKLYEDIVKLNKPRKITLIRYFNYITPYIKKTNIIEDQYELKFIDNSNRYINTKKYNVLNRDNINIYKYNGIQYYDGQYLESVHGYSEDAEIIYQNEYKHFNDNLIFNLKEEIIIEDNKEYNESELIKFKEDKEAIQTRKINILLKYFYDLGLDYKDIILFLFNKYDSNMNIDPIKLRSTKNEKLYRVTYKFNLI